MKKQLNNLGSRLKDYRKRAKFTQEKAAELLGITSGYISKIECGNISPSLDLLYKFSKAYDCTITISHSKIDTASEIQCQISYLVEKQGVKQQRTALKVLEAIFE